MRLTHYGHACVVIEDPDGSTGRILIDPGNLSDDITGVGPIDAVLVTHEHPDHLDDRKLADLRSADKDLALYGNPGLPTVLRGAERDRMTVLESDGTSSAVIAGWQVDTHTTTHATIYSALPDITNNAYLVGGRLWHPGDALDMPPSPVDVLLVPIGAPWLKLSEAIEYVRAVEPRVAIPIHQGGLRAAHRELHGGLLTKFAPKDTEVLVTISGQPVTF